MGAFAAGPMGLPHGPQSLLKTPQDLHREDIKPLAGPSADERLVSILFILINMTHESRMGSFVTKFKKGHMIY